MEREVWESIPLPPKIKDDDFYEFVGSVEKVCLFRLSKSKRKLTIWDLSRNINEEMALSRNRNECRVADPTKMETMLPTLEGLLNSILGHERHLQRPMIMAVDSYLDKSRGVEVVIFVDATRSFIFSNENNFPHSDVRWLSCISDQSKVDGVATCVNDLPT
ncbi:hypothetical protein AMTR_s00074p00185860 [Amborella trichopoda]|uniref:Uncharacterized protein n=1 Tax=Amborella trichopoda TaxID=13333 RepID=W1NPN0_AMBTC|nr:hypothetical protein AMTR_s00074p00185860 [Amborella trichopoda]